MHVQISWIEGNFFFLIEGTCHLHSGFLTVNQKVKLFGCHLQICLLFPFLAFIYLLYNYIKMFDLFRLQL